MDSCELLSTLIHRTVAQSNPGSPRLQARGKANGAGQEPSGGVVTVTMEWCCCAVASVGPEFEAGTGLHKGSPVRSPLQPGPLHHRSKMLISYG